MSFFKIFKVDTDQDGTVDFDELMQYIEEIMAEQPNSDEVMDAFNMIDEDGSGEVSHEEVRIALWSVMKCNGVLWSVIECYGVLLSVIECY